MQPTITKKDKYIELNYSGIHGYICQNELKDAWSDVANLDPEKCSGVYIDTGHTLLDKNAREFLMNETIHWPAIAVLVNNAGQRLMGNFILAYMHKKANMKLFSNEANALLWLKKELDLSRKN